MRELRRTFECALKMLFECPNMKNYMESLFMQVELRGVKSIKEGYPCIEPEDVEKLFLKGNLELVNDIWSPILDVVENDFICTNGFWGGRFLKATANVLAWMVTHHMKSENARENSMFKPNHYRISADLVSIAITKADEVFGGQNGQGPISEWPVLRKPPSWDKKKGMVKL